jgi:hypothetical protein
LAERREVALGWSFFEAAWLSIFRVKRLAAFALLHAFRWRAPFSSRQSA